MQVLAQLARDTFIETFGHLYAAHDLNAYLDSKCSTPYFTDASQHTSIMIAWEEAKAVGYIKWGAVEVPVTDEVAATAREIHRLYVHKTHQGQGTGKQLFEYALAECAEVSAIYLGVWEHNLNARRFYEAYGFTCIGEYAFPVGAHRDRELILRKVM